jgi:hypothetical protein
MQSMGVAYCNQQIGFTHGVDEHLQFISYLKDANVVPRALMQYVFTFAGGRQKIDNFDEVYLKNKEDFGAADVALVEICSLKRFVYNGVFLQKSRFEDWEQWDVDAPSQDLCEAVVRSQIERDELFEKLDVLVEKLAGKRIVFTGHINSDLKGKEIKSRSKINRWMRDYCVTNGYGFYDVSRVVRFWPRLFIYPDAIHFKKAGKLITFFSFLWTLYFKRQP